MDLSSPRLGEIDALFREALERPPEERAAYLTGAAASDPELRAAVQALLDAYDEDESSVLELAGDAQMAAWQVLAQEEKEEEEAAKQGERIGRYRIIEKLARGGWGTVFLAERDDGEFRHQVAIKVLRRGLDTEDVLARFRAERQILASLNHPNIAGLLDGGTTEDGRPYLVMEYVGGRRIDDYCDERCLPVEERLRLFVVVARAVQHAHRSLVIHRDIKPSNILVTPDGTVKLLDFGIAKLLDSSEVPASAPMTLTGSRLLTPEYASPEQMRGDPVTTASDVYQLGLLLYELLTGQRPRTWSADGGPLDHVLTPSRALRAATRTPEGLNGVEAVSGARGTDPKRLERGLRGDLDTIVAMALRPEVERRYASADHLADDVERYLARLPVSAQRDTLAYRGRKLLRRQRWLAPTAAVLVLFTAGYVLTLVRHAAQLEQERNAAQEEAARAQEVKQLLVDLFQSPDPFAPDAERQGRDVTVREALTVGAERVRTELADRPALRAELLDAISEVLNRLDVTDEALKLREEALATETSLFGENSLQVAGSLGEMGSLLQQRGMLDSAEVLETKSVRIVRELRGPGHPEVAEGLVRLGLVHSVQGRFTEAAGDVSEAVRIYRQVDPVPEEALADALETLSDILLQHDDLAGAESAAEETIRLREETLGPRNPTTALARIALAQVHYAARSYHEASELYDQALPVLESELGETHRTTLTALNDYALLLSRMGDQKGAEAIYRRLLAARRSRYGAVSEPVASTLQNLAVTLGRQGRPEEAEPLHRQARAVYEEVLGPAHYLGAFPLLSLVQIELDQGRFQEAESSALQAAEILRRALPPGHFATVMAECRLGRALAGEGRIPQALPILESSVESLQTNTQVPVEYQQECQDALAAVRAQDGG